MRDQVDASARTARRECGDWHKPPIRPGLDEETRRGIASVKDTVLLQQVWDHLEHVSLKPQAQKP